MRFLLVLLLLTVVSKTKEEARLSSLSSPHLGVYRPRPNRTLINTNRLRSVVRKKVKRIIKAKKLLKTAQENGIIDRLNR